MFFPGRGFTLFDEYLRIYGGLEFLRVSVLDRSYFIYDKLDRYGGCNTAKIMKNSPH